MNVVSCVIKLSCLTLLWERGWGQNFGCREEEKERERAAHVVTFQIYTRLITRNLNSHHKLSAKYNQSQDVWFYQLLSRGYGVAAVWRDSLEEDTD